MWGSPVNEGEEIVYIELKKRELLEDITDSLFVHSNNNLLLATLEKISAQFLFPWQYGMLGRANSFPPINFIPSVLFLDS